MSAGDIFSIVIACVALVVAIITYVQTRKYYK